jgi:thiol-disulfide isomerase/thioredoxin
MLVVAAVGPGLTAAKVESQPSTAEAEQPLIWFHSYYVGMKAAVTGERPVLIDFNASWCAWCAKMDREVFAQPQIITKLNKFVCIKVDVDQDHNVALAYGVQSLPRILVLNVHREIVGDWLGFRDAPAFSELLDDVSQYLYRPTGAAHIPKIPLADSDVEKEIEQIQVDPNAGKQFTELLGHSKAAVRRKVIEALVQKGPDVLELVLPALESKYLGTRIAAWKVVRQLNVADLSFDPWASRLQRADAVKRLKEQIERRHPKTHPQTNGREANASVIGGQVSARMH